MKADILDGVATSVQYADLAEKFTADQYEVGTVLMFGGPKRTATKLEKTTKSGRCCSC